MDSDQAHAYGDAYYPPVSSSLSSWLQDQQRADDDAHLDVAHSADDFYTSSHVPADHHLAHLPRQRIDMAAPTRQRQATTNGARSPPKPASRSIPGPPSSATAAAATATATATRVSPQTASNVKALTERFEPSPGSNSTGPAPTVRSTDRNHTRATSHEIGKRQTASAARPSKEASYGTYQFNHLKPRERPQPAPAAPRSARRTNGSRSSIETPLLPPKKKGTTPNRPQRSSSRQPFFGEVVNADVTSPGFGIENPFETLAAHPRSRTTSFSSSQHHRSFSGPASIHPEEHPTLHASEQTASLSSQQTSSPSRIPVASRRLSATSDSSSSSRSVKYTPTRPINSNTDLSPTNRRKNNPVGSSSSAKLPGQDPMTLSALAYRGYRERGKSPLGMRSGSSVQAVVTASPAPTSPRLRNSRERQTLQPSPKYSSRGSDSHGDPGYPIRRSFGSQSLHKENHSISAHPHEHLTLQTSALSPPIRHSISTSMDFDESPILGLPGSFVLTPPTAHEEPDSPLLPSTSFQIPAKMPTSNSPEIDQSELGVRESIPIMLGEDEPPDIWGSSYNDMSQGLKSLSFDHSSDHAGSSRRTRRSSGSTLEDSPIDPFYRRETLRPEDSASVAPYQTVASLAFTTETYSVVNSVLNMYHQSPIISADLAATSKQRVQQVSPTIAQHKDWTSKEATETYLARVLSDANELHDTTVRERCSKSDSHSLKVQNSPQYDDGIFEPESAGTAIIYPSESRNYSPGSGGSTATTIQDDISHSGPSSRNRSQDSLLGAPMDDYAQASPTGAELAQLAWNNSGLGLSLASGSPQVLSQHTPPRPIYSPPPPPAKQMIDSCVAPSRGHLSRTSASGEHFALHPARSSTPIIAPNEQSLEDRYGAPNPVRVVSPPLIDSDRSSNDQPDPAKQALIKRYRILEELLTTEHQFCIDMMIAHNIFEATAQNMMSEKEKKMLFSNCKELEKFSLSLFRSFKKAAKSVVNHEIPPPTGPWNHDSSDLSEPIPTILRSSEDSQNQFENCTPENDRQTTIGQVFLENREKMERLYTTYFLNQDNASAYIKKNQGNPELAQWVVACFEQVENMTQAWDLDSLLLKPCQRLLKYPLLLEGLISCSELDHPDLQQLKDAKAELLEINVRINEAKARADTFRAAASEGKKEKSRGKGIGKTFVKAFIPKVDKSKAFDEADRAFKDQEYKSREQKFGGHFFQLQIVIRDFEQYLEAITEHYMQLNIVFLGFITLCEVAPSVYPEIESTWRKWAMAHFELQNKALEEHKTAVRSRVLKPVGDLWEMWVSYQKTIEQRKKFLLYYVKYKQALDRGEKVDPDLEEQGKKFTTINDTLKHELPLLYERTKGLMRTLMTLFMCLQKAWYKTCSRKILPLLESEPQHTTSLRYDMESYVERFHSDYKPMQDLANKLGIINRNLLSDISNMTSPNPTFASDGGSSGRNSSSRRTESSSGDVVLLDQRNRNSSGQSSRSHARNHDNTPRSTHAGSSYPLPFQTLQQGRAGPGPTSLREARALSPVSDQHEPIRNNSRPSTGTGRSRNYSYQGDSDGHSPMINGSFDFPPQLGASFLSPIAMPPPLIHSVSAPNTHHITLPGPSHVSGIFNSALPMSESPMRTSHEDLPTTPADTDEPEVLFLAASLFEFNIAHDRREGGIPYLVYVPGEIFDVIGMKGELWLARNQDDSTKTVGWIWEKHFARILPEDS